jgi:two-component system sensor histidine kinase PilS (NtrC family)
MLARLGVTLASLGVALGLHALGRELPVASRNGLYYTVAFAFFMTVVSAIGERRRWSDGLAVTIQIGTDVCLVSSLVYFTGGFDSIFTFLYVLVTVYGAVLFQRTGAVVAATLSSAAYGLVLFGGRFVDMPESGYSSDAALSVGLATWGVHVAALYLVGLLASVLSGELHRTGRALDQRTSDLQALRDLYQRTVESIMSGLLTIDLEGRITSFNPEAERITGLSAKEAIGCDLEALIPGSIDVALKERLVEPGIQPDRKRLVYDNARGEERWLGLAGSVLRNEFGAPIGHVIIFTDVTDVVTMERELRRSERMAAVGGMAAKIAHEIRNPLASISGSIEILKGSGPGPEEGESSALMEIVLRETERLNQLITDFLQFSRPAPPLREKVQLGDVADEVLQVLRGTLPPEIRAEGPEESREAALGDERQLRQVVWNLCLNAVQAMPKGGCLRLSLRAEPGEPAQEADENVRNEGMVASPRSAGWVELAISDTGDGIPEELQAEVFEPFFTTKEEGSGLGLATVHSIVERHGGELLLESRLGLGTTFRVRLPRYSPPAEESR